MNKKNAAIYCLSSRKDILMETLECLYDNWNIKFDYPVYIHYWGKVYDDKNFIGKINSKISTNIKFLKIKTEVPAHVYEKDLFYNRTYNPYVKKKFSKKRLGYLHMCRFATNINNYGSIGCLGESLRKYDHLMRIDDDSWFIKKIEFDLFDEKHILSSGFSAERVSLKVRKNCSENLFKFYKNYLKKNNIIPKSDIMKKIIESNDEDAFLQLPLPAGNLTILNIKEFLKYPWNNYLKEINEYAGDYKYRWGDTDVIGIFAYTFFDNPIHNYDLVNRGYYLAERKNSGLAPDPDSYLNYYSENFLIKSLKKIYSYYKK
jgi:hypothetical protein